MKRNVEILWDLGFSDETILIFLEKDNKGNLQIIEKFKGTGGIDKYIEYIEHKSKEYNYIINHLPKEAYLNSFGSNNSIVNIIKKAGFPVN